VVDEFLALCAKRGVPVARVGEVTAEPVLDFGVLSVGLDEAREAWLAPIPAALG
jgi:phosphoribosylformylglycinamidine synthase